MASAAQAFPQLQQAMAQTRGPPQQGAPPMMQVPHQFQGGPKGQFKGKGCPYPGGAGVTPIHGKGGPPQMQVPGATSLPGKGGPPMMQVPGPQSQPGPPQQPQPIYPPLKVHGCLNGTVRNIIEGTYTNQNSNHGKPVYKRDMASMDAEGVVSTVLIYYWDDRDGPFFNGWWFGPKVGGDQVWAYNGDQMSALPPINGWKVPWDGPVDESLRVDNCVAAPDAPSVALPTPLAPVPSAPGRAPPPPPPPRAGQGMDGGSPEDGRRQMPQEDESTHERQAAAMVVRRVIDRVRNATLENFDDLRAELERTQTEQLERLGPQAESLLLEAEKAMLMAQERIDDMIRKRAEEEQKHLENEKRKAEEEKEATRMVQESEDELVTAESKVAEVAEMGKPIKALSEDTPPEDVIQAVAATEGAVEAAQELLDALSRAMWARKDDFGKSDIAVEKLRKELSPCFGRLATCRRNLERVRETGRTAKDRATRKIDLRRREAERKIQEAKEEEERKAAAEKKEKEQKAAFEKYDADGDGQLNRSEVEAYAKGDHDFELADAQLKKIFILLTDSDQGVLYDKFPRLISMVSGWKADHVAKEEKARKEEEIRLKREQEEKQRQALEAKKAELRQQLDGPDGALREAGDAAEKADDLARAMAQKGSEELTSRRLRELASEVDAAVQPALDALARAAELLTAVEAEVVEDGEALSFRDHETHRMRKRASTLKARAEKAASAANGARERAVRQAVAELDAKRVSLVDILRKRMAEASKTAEQLLEDIAGSDSNEVPREKVLGYMKSIEALDLEDGMAEKLFERIAPGAESLSRGSFSQLVRVFYKAAAACSITETSEISSTTVRKLEVGETVEAIEGPIADGSNSVLRARCRVVRDGTTGWVTVKGIKGGAALLEPTSLTMLCVKDTVMTDGLSVQGSKTVRKIKTKEVLDVLEAEQKDTSVDVMRIKAKAKSDGSVGFVTVASNQGTKFLEPR